MKIVSKPLNAGFMGEIVEIEMFHLVTAMGNPVGPRQYTFQ